MNHVIESWHTDEGRVELKCGDSHEGWEHFKHRDRTQDADLDDILDCIGRVLDHAGEPEIEGNQYRYSWRWASGRGNKAVVRVLRETGSVVTAYPGSGSPETMVRKWAECAGR